MTKTATVSAQQRWEYAELTRKTQSYLIAEMTELGLAGWELVSITKHKESRPGAGEAWYWTAFLKRPHAGPVGPTPATESEKEATARAMPISKPASLQPSESQDDEVFEFAASPADEPPADPPTTTPQAGD